MSEQKMRDANMPLLDRIDAAIKRVTSGQGQMRVPVEATDPDVVLGDCKREIEKLMAEVHSANGRASEWAEIAGEHGAYVDRMRRLVADAAYLDRMRRLVADAAGAIKAGRLDAARLDHIEKHARFDPQIDGNNVYWPTTFNQRLRGPTLRAAIDAQMRGEDEA